MRKALRRAIRENNMHKCLSSIRQTPASFGLPHGFLRQNHSVPLTLLAKCISLSVQEEHADTDFL